MVKRGKGIGIYVYSIGYLIVKMKMWPGDVTVPGILTQGIIVPY
jgi:hypothetical protein